MACRRARKTSTKRFTLPIGDTRKRLTNIISWRIHVASCIPIVNCAIWNARQRIATFARRPMKMLSLRVRRRFAIVIRWSCLPPDKPMEDPRYEINPKTIWPAAVPRLKRPPPWLPSTVVNNMCCNTIRTTRTIPECLKLKPPPWRSPATTIRFITPYPVNPKDINSRITTQSITRKPPTSRHTQSNRINHPTHRLIPHQCRRSSNSLRFLVTIQIIAQNLRHPATRCITANTASSRRISSATAATQMICTPIIIRPPTNIIHSSIT